MCCRGQEKFQMEATSESSLTWLFSHVLSVRKHKDWKKHYPNSSSILKTVKSVMGFLMLWFDQKSDYGVKWERDLSKYSQKCTIDLGDWLHLFYLHCTYKLSDRQNEIKGVLPKCLIAKRTLPPEKKNLLEKLHCIMICIIIAYPLPKKHWLSLTWRNSSPFQSTWGYQLPKLLSSLEDDNCQFGPQALQRTWHFPWVPGLLTKLITLKLSDFFQFTLDKSKNKSHKIYFSNAKHYVLNYDT